MATLGFVGRPRGRFSWLPLANGWTKYGCGNNEELREKISKLLKTRYPKSKWTAKIIEEESQNQ